MTGQTTTFICGSSTAGDRGPRLRRLERPSSRSPVARAVKGLAHAVPVFRRRLCDDVVYYMRELIELRPEVVHAWQDATNIKVGIAAALLGVPRIVLSTRNMAAVRFAYYHPYMWPAYRALERLPNVVFVNNSPRRVPRTMRAGCDCPRTVSK